jgi:hypothetical protein
MPLLPVSRAHAQVSVSLLGPQRREKLQVLSHCWRVHTPFVHRKPEVQRLPQEPQFRGSLLVSMQVPEQSCTPRPPQRGGVGVGSEGVVVFVRSEEVEEGGSKVVVEFRNGGVVEGVVADVEEVPKVVLMLAVDDEIADVVLIVEIGRVDVLLKLNVVDRTLEIDDVFADAEVEESSVVVLVGHSVVEFAYGGVGVGGGLVSELVV